MYIKTTKLLCVKHNDGQLYTDFVFPHPPRLPPCLRTLNNPASVCCASLPKPLFSLHWMPLTPSYAHTHFSSAASFRGTTPVHLLQLVLRRARSAREACRSQRNVVRRRRSLSHAHNQLKANRFQHTLVTHHYTSLSSLCSFFFSSFCSIYGPSKCERSVRQTEHALGSCTHPVSTCILRLFFFFLFPPAGALTCKDADVQG